MTNLYDLEWENIHSHSHYSNIMTPDSEIKPEDLAKRAVAMGQKTISTVEHGYFGSIFDYYETAQEYRLKLIFGIEYYFVKDRLIFFSNKKTNKNRLFSGFLFFSISNPRLARIRAKFLGLS